MVRSSVADLRPEDLLHFVELRSFTEVWDNELGLTDNDLLALQISIMLRPAAAPVVQGTGGLRKLRFAPLRSTKGKRGGIRVCYVHFEEFGIVLLVSAYAKSRRDDLSENEKRGIRILIERISLELERRRTLD